MADRAWSVPEKKACKQPMGRLHGNSDLGNAWGTQRENYSFFLECIPEKQHSWRHFSRNKGSGWHHFLPIAQHKYRDICGKQHNSNTCYLICFHQTPHPSALRDCPSFMLVLVLSQWAPHRKLTQIPIHIMFLHTEFYKTLDLVQMVSGLIL